MNERTHSKNRTNKGTFIIEVTDQANASWQGRVTWVNGKQKQYFRSTLELIKMIDAALETETIEIESHEKQQEMRSEKQ